MKKKFVKLALLSAFIGLVFAGCSVKASAEGTFAPAYLTGGTKSTTSQGGGNCGN